MNSAKPKISYVLRNTAAHHSELSLDEQLAYYSVVDPAD
jgi:hypothetical protein